MMRIAVLFPTWSGTPTSQYWIDHTQGLWYKECVVVPMAIKPERLWNVYDGMMTKDRMDGL